ncbi:DUF2599 domain-containing protein [Isoptericola sp. NPDC019693]|uniref:DUF2599 domain-containing protein n=1 Tax=Isoptericola sp. NPDC019693 TaxID=3364009 RepID=UPI0037AABF73
MPPRRRTRAPLASAVAAALLTLAACTPSPPASSGPPTATPGATTPGPTAPAPDSPVRVEVASRGVTLEVSVPGATPDAPRVHVSSDGGSTATVALEPADDAGPPTITLTSDGSLEPHPDGSVTVRAAGVAVGGLSAPRGARLLAVDGTHLEVRTSSGGTADGTDGTESNDEVVTTTLGTAAVESTDWGEREGGRSLAVVPTAWTRAAGQAGVDVVWAELVATDPEVDTPTMRDQLECHALGARDKDSWNLEPWRPDVGLVATMAARCNPTS